MTNDCTKQKKSKLACCGYGLIILLTGVLCVVITHQMSIRIAESTIFFETENISLLRTYDLSSRRSDKVLLDETKNAYFRGRDIKALLWSVAHNQDSDNIALLMSRYNPQIQPTQIQSSGIILREYDDYLVVVKYIRVRGSPIVFDIRARFKDKSHFSFYLFKITPINTVKGNIQGPSQVTQVATLP